MREKEPLLRIREVLSRRPNVLYSVLFGSAARGELREDSDMDIAFRFSSEPDIMEKGELASLLEYFSGREVHIVDMGRAPPPLRDIQGRNSDIREG